MGLIHMLGMLVLVVVVGQLNGLSEEGAMILGGLLFGWGFLGSWLDKQFNTPWYERKWPWQ